MCSCRRSGVPITATLMPVISGPSAGSGVSPASAPRAAKSRLDRARPQSACGSPSANWWKSATATSWSNPSVLLTASNNRLAAAPREPRDELDPAASRPRGRPPPRSAGPLRRSRARSGRSSDSRSHPAFSTSPPVSTTMQGTSRAARKSVLPIARQAWQIGHQRIARAGHGIEQGRLAHVRPADQCDYRQHGPNFRRRRRGRRSRGGRLGRGRRSGGRRRGSGRRAGELETLGVARYAASVHHRSTPRRCRQHAAGGLETRCLAMRSRATSSPVPLSSQCM